MHPAWDAWIFRSLLLSRKVTAMKRTNAKRSVMPTPHSFEAVVAQLAQLQAQLAAISGAKVTVSKASPKGKVVTMIENMTSEEWAIRAKAYKAAKKQGGTYQDWNEAGAAAVWAARNA